MHVGAEGERAVLYVEWEAKDFKVTGANQPQHPVIADVSGVVHVNIRASLRHVIIHTVKKERYKY